MKFTCTMPIAMAHHAWTVCASNRSAFYREQETPQSYVSGLKKHVNFNRDWTIANTTQLTSNHAPHNIRLPNKISCFILWRAGACVDITTQSSDSGSCYEATQIDRVEYSLSSQQERGCDCSQDFVEVFDLLIPAKNKSISL